MKPKKVSVEVWRCDRVLESTNPIGEGFKPLNPQKEPFWGPYLYECIRQPNLPNLKDCPKGYSNH